MRHAAPSTSQRRFVALGAGISLMVLVITWLFIGNPRVHAAGNIYYVATNGNDGNNGLSVGGAYQHIQKCASVMVAGDTCLIESGTYHETVTPTNSGTSSAPITYQPDSGASVTIDGADVVTGWSVYSGNIYRASVTLPVTGPQDTGFLANQIFVGGQMMTEARWPNTGSDLLKPTWATMQAGTTSTTIVDSNIPAIDWTGALAHVWAGNDPYGNQTGTVTTSSSGQVTLSINTADGVCPDLCPKSGGYYYLQGKLAALDSANEWYYDGTNHYLYLWAPNNADPSTLTVEAKQRTNAFNLNGRSYTTIQSLTLFGSTIQTDTSSQNVVIDGLTATYPSHFTTIPGSGFLALRPHSTDTGIILAGTYDTIRNSSISNSAGNGIFLAGNHNTATNNVIHDVSYMGTYAAGIQWFGNYSSITHNSIYRTGQDGITYDWGSAGTNYNTTGELQGQNSDISYNDISSNLLLTTDKGGIDICCSVDGTGTNIHHNLFHDIVLGDPANYGIAAAIYPDNSSNHFTIHHNVTWNTPEGVRMNEPGGSYNHIYNNTLASTTSIAASNPSSTGIEVKNNIFRGPNNLSTGIQSNNLPSTTDPLFQNTTAYNYALQDGSPAIDAGTVVSGITDGYLGSAPDIGAYESGAAMWAAGSTLATKPANQLIQAERYSSQSGVNDFGTGLGSLDDGDYACYSSVDFGLGVSTFQARIGVPAAYAGKHVEVRLDSTSGTLLGTLTVQSTGDFSTYTTQSVGVNSASGVHTLCLVFRGGSGVGNLDWFSFTPTTTTIDDNAGGWTYSGTWGSGSSVTGNYNSTGHWSQTANSTASYSFTGTSARFYGRSGTDSGIATVQIDSGTTYTIDLYASSVQGNYFEWASPTLSSGAHTIVITVTGTKDASSSNTWVQVDRLDVVTSNPSAIDDNGSGWTYSGTWGSGSSVPGNYNSTGHWSQTANSTASYSFAGTGVRFYGRSGTDSGIASVQIDGGSTYIVDLYVSSVQGNYFEWGSPTLSSGSHTIVITVTGTHSTNSSNTWVQVDRLDVDQ